MNHIEAWQPVPGTLPPDPDSGGDSPLVWLALSDGRVLTGQALHRATVGDADPSARDWYMVLREQRKVKVINCLGAGVTVVAWMPITAPDHPSAGPQPTKTYWTGDECMEEAWRVGGMADRAVSEADRDIFEKSARTWAQRAVAGGYRRGAGEIHDQKY